MKVILELQKLVFQNCNYFHNLYYKRSLFFQEKIKKGQYYNLETLKIPSEIDVPKKYQSLVIQHFEIIKTIFIEILHSPNSAVILWNFSSVSIDNSQSFLTKLIPSLEAISTTKRGGINIYKLNGWVIHVLIGYSIVAHYIPDGSLPKTIEWTPDIVKVFSEKLRPLYNHLSKVSKLVLKTAMLGHDIGVVVEIIDHDRHGKPLVRNFLNELHFSDANLKEFYIDYADFLWAVEIIVEFHAFINKIGLEISIKRASKDISKLITEIPKENSWRHSFLKNDFPIILLLITISDVIAVNDNIMTDKKIKDILKRYDMLRSIISGEQDNFCDAIKSGYGRFCDFLPDLNIQINKKNFDDVILFTKSNIEEVWTKFYLIEEIDFAISIISQFSNPSDALILFLYIFKFIDQYLNLSLSDYESVVVKFDDKVDPLLLQKQVTFFYPRDGSLQITPQLIENGWRYGGLVLISTREKSGYKISIKQSDSD